MLKVPDHQVAGHQAGHGHPGPLIDDSGRFYKPLQDDDRGAIEAAFYTSFSSNTRVPDHIRRFFPVFYGTKLLASDGSGQWPHLVLEDVVSGLSHPSVMDVKIGSRTWYPEASEDYIQRCFMKDRKTSSLDLGFRISGLQLYESEESGLWKPDRKLVQHLSADEVRVVLKKFVSSNSPIDPNLNPDCSFASSVYGGSSGILAQLLELKSWFEDQTIYHLNSCSVLMVYDKKKELKGESSDAKVKLIDFAHVTEGNGIIDHNFVGGLCSLIKFISDILTSPDECTTKACLQNSDNNNEEILTGSNECTTKLSSDNNNEEILTASNECTTKLSL
ncbi:inositol polyphosphate multikinase [Salix suchowensis]|nr:inositol polyphosphate multikinase [Salix suchowensis]